MPRIVAILAEIFLKCFWIHPVALDRSFVTLPGLIDLPNRALAFSMILAKNFFTTSMTFVMPLFSLAAMILSAVVLANLPTFDATDATRSPLLMLSSIIPVRISLENVSFDNALPAPYLKPFTAEEVTSRYLFLMPPPIRFLRPETALPALSLRPETAMPALVLPIASPMKSPPAAIFPPTNFPPFTIFPPMNFPPLKISLPRFLMFSIPPITLWIAFLPPS